jgi:hypothetical protein
MLALVLLDGCGARPAQPVVPAAAVPATEAADSAGASPDPSVTSPAAAAPSAGPAASHTPVVQTTTVAQTEAIPFTTKRVNDASLPKGTEKVKKEGANGVRTLTYQVTLTDGVQTAKKLVSQKVTKAPVTRVVAVGTKQASRCDPNYSGCVPVASDVDCAGGSGDGPAYVDGPVQVIGTDVYRLDSDHDGVACE